MKESHTQVDVQTAAADRLADALRLAGRMAAARLDATQTGCDPGPMRERVRRAQADIRVTLDNAAASTDAGQWLRDNARLIRTAAKDTKWLALALREYPCAEVRGEAMPRVVALAAEYLQAAGGRFSEAALIAFLDEFQQRQPLTMGELWAVKPALQFRLVEHVAEGPDGDIPIAVNSLRALAEAQWNDLFETVSRVDAVLRLDPAEAYSAMDFESRDLYRNRIAKLARHSPQSEIAIAEAALQLAREAAFRADGSRYWRRRAHVGFYLLDRGEPVLREAVRYRPPRAERLRDWVLAQPDAYYLIGIEVLTLAVVALALNSLDAFTPFLTAALLLVIPASQTAVDLMNNLTSFLLRPRALPKLDFSEGIPDECAAVVAVPTLLLHERQVRDLFLDLEIRYLANRDPNLYFALLTDPPDADEPGDHGDTLLQLCRELLDDLNRRYGQDGRGPFYLFHRHRTFNPSEGRWMGWERKRGKLLDLNQLLRGGYDSFPEKRGDLGALGRVRYVITLDSDTQLPRGAAATLLGAIGHPLNQAVVDPHTQMVAEGYGLLQPRIGISVQSASRSRLARLYSGQTGFDIYTRAISDVYQDLYGEGIFTGKGVYEVDVFRQVLENRFPDNALLSHDLIEGAYTRVALASDIELIDDYPSHFSAYSRRKHRWVRGDWQILRWLLTKVPDRHGNRIWNPISVISRWKIFDNLRRSLYEPAALALFVAGWFFLAGGPAHWTLVSVLLLLTPVYVGLLFSLLRAPRALHAVWPWLKDTAGEFVRGHALAFLNLALLPHQALLSLDAIARSLARVFVTRRRLLEWETAAEAEEQRSRKATVDKYLEWTPWLTALLAIVLAVIRPEALPVASPVLLLWLGSRALTWWLNRPPRAPRTALTAQDRILLRDSAVQTWRYFREWSQPMNWLIPDHVREDGAAISTLSPTNLGFLLNARAAAVRMGYLTVREFVAQTRATLDHVLLLRRCRGHLLNWYDSKTLLPMEPVFVSTVDSGNLAACLWTLKQAALDFIKNPPSQETQWRAIEDVARQCRVGFSLRSASAGPDLSNLRRQVDDYAAQAKGEEATWAEELGARLAAIDGPHDQDLAPALRDIAETAGRLAEEMDFSFLFHERRKVLSVGYDTVSERLETSAYDLLASESRIASFIGIAKGDLPVEAWFHLGRRHTLSGGERVLVSWTGTMFEYLMPALWMRHYRQTILHDSMLAAVRVQRRYANRAGIPWGVSESGYRVAEGEYGYAAFGIPELSMKTGRPEALVVSPYATFLALPFAPKAAVENLRRMAERGWRGRYGFYEAIDFTGGDASPVRTWMAHHQGMILLSLCNFLCGEPLRDWFHAEPMAQATELLLHERVPKWVEVDAAEVETPASAPAAT